MLTGSRSSTPQHVLLTAAPFSMSRSPIHISLLEGEQNSLSLSSSLFYISPIHSSCKCSYNTYLLLLFLLFLLPSLYAWITVSSNLNSLTFCCLYLPKTITSCHWHTRLVRRSKVTHFKFLHLKDHHLTLPNIYFQPLQV